MNKEGAVCEGETKDQEKGRPMRYMARSKNICVSHAKRGMNQLEITNNSGLKYYYSECPSQANSNSR